MKYIGTKIIDATPMTRAEYNSYRGWTLPANEDGNDAGFLVEYLDGGKANDPRHTGYISWSPTDVFNNAYRPINGMSFGMVLEALQIGKAVARSGWNGKGMFVLRIQGSNKLASIHGFGFGEYLGEPTFRDALFMRTVDNQLVPWTISQTDALAQDWEILT